MTRKNTEADFWAKVDRSAGDDECWPWTGKCHARTGHGLYYHDGLFEFAHRYAFTVVTGKAPIHNVLHHCDNPPCCNVRAHLYDGTQIQNVRDREARGRRPPTPTGQNHPLSKLTDAQTDEIVAMYGTGAYNQKQLGALFNVDGSVISRVIHGGRRRADGTRTGINARISEQLAAKRAAEADATRG